MFRIFGRSSRPSDAAANRDSKRPIFLAARSSQAFIIATISMSVFTDIFLYAVIVPVIPFALRERAGIVDADRQYYVSVLLAAYGAAVFVTSPICGWISDKLSSRLLPFLSGLLLLAGATLCLCLGKSIPVLIVGRILQGASAAVVWTIGLALLVDTVGREKVGWALGFPSSAMSLALLTAPPIGGAVFSQTGYYPVYGLCFGMIGVDLVMRLAVIEKRTRRYWIGDSRANSAHATPGRTTPRTPRSGQATPPTETSHPNAIISATRDSKSVREALPTSLDHEDAARIIQSRFKRRWNFRLPPVLTLLSSLRLVVALWSAFVQAVILTAFDSTIPLYVRQIWGWGSLNSGLLFLPLVVPTFSAPYFGFIADKYGPRYITAAGFALICPCVVLLRLIDENTVGHKIGMCALLFCTGAAFSMAFAPIMAEITYAVRSKEQPTAKREALDLGKNGAFGQAYALFNVAFAAGCLVGPIWGGMIRDVAGWGTMTWTLGLLSFATAIPVVIWVGGYYFNQHKRHWRREGPTNPQSLDLNNLEEAGDARNTGESQDSTTFNQEFKRTIGSKYDQNTKSSSSSPEVVSSRFSEAGDEMNKQTGNRWSSGRPASLIPSEGVHAEADTSIQTLWSSPGGTNSRFRGPDAAEEQPNY